MLRIGVTACSSFERYAAWIAGGVPEVRQRRTGDAPVVTGVEIVRLSVEEGNAGELDACNALVLTGGGDVHPRFYGESSRIVELDPKDVSEARDEFEIGLINEARERFLPMLGICRGLQMANVAFGGTLILDLERAGYENHRKYEPGRDREHDVTVEEDSMLESILGVRSGRVNSSHHQAAAIVPESLFVAAKSPDGVVEALEPADGRLFLFVQWHPERMGDLSSRFSFNIRTWLCDAARRTLVNSHQ